MHKHQYLQQQCSVHLGQKTATGAGLNAFLKFVVSSSKLDWAILENVRSMTFKARGDGNRSPVEVQNSEMQKRGAINVSELITSKNWGLPQSRVRMYMLYMKGRAMKGSQPEMGRTFLSLQMKPLPITSVLHGNVDDAYVPKTRKDNNKVKWTGKWEAACAEFGQENLTRISHYIR